MAKGIINRVFFQIKKKYDKSRMIKIGNLRDSNRHTTPINKK